MVKSIGKFPAANKVFPQVHSQPQSGAEYRINGNGNDQQLTRVIRAARYVANVSTVAILLLILLIISFFALVNFFNSQADSSPPRTLETYDPTELKEYLYLNRKRSKFNYDYYDDYHPLLLPQEIMDVDERDFEERSTARVDSARGSVNIVAQPEGKENITTWQAPAFSSSSITFKDGVTSEKERTLLLNNTHCQIMNIFDDIQETPSQKIENDTEYAESKLECSLDGNLTTVFGKEGMSFLMRGRDLRCCVMMTSILPETMRKFPTNAVRNKNVSKTCTSIETVNDSLKMQLKSMDTSLLLKCNDSNSTLSMPKRLNQLLLNVRKEEAIKEKERYWKLREKNQEQPLSILIIGIDGLSRFKARQYLPKTFSLLKANNFTEMKGYHLSSSDGNFLPLFMGLSFRDFLRSRLRIDDFNRDKIAFVWKEFHSLNYITTFAGEPPEGIRSLFYSDEAQYFDYLINNDLVNFVEGSMSPKCNSKSKLEWTFDILKEIILKRHDSTPKLNLLWMNLLSVEEKISPFPNLMKVFFSNILKSLDDSAKLANSIIFFITNAGYSNPIMEDDINEHRLPSLFIRLPAKLTERADKSSEIQNFVDNQNRLVTPFSVHQTLRWLQTVESNTNSIASDSDPLNEDHFSLFDAIPEKLTCENQKIQPHLCACDHLDLMPISPGDEKLVMRMRKRALNFVNNIITRYFDVEDKCMKLKYHKSTHLKKYLVNSDVQQSGLQLRYVFNFRVIPSGNIFQATFTFFPKLGHLILNPPVEVLNLKRRSKFDGYCYTSKNSTEFV
ncbi:unnamed protein product [Orchesella dallaii]|uniref:Uncharacterized protein n=1 Tax=Orchesella dallaii TaxID=48710 RepID=A0ABP1S5K6_9HEXA